MQKVLLRIGLIVLGIIALAVLIYQILKRYVFCDKETFFPGPMPAQSKCDELELKQAAVKAITDQVVGVDDEPPPPPEIKQLNVPLSPGVSFAAGQDTADAEELWTLLQNEGFRQRGEGFRKEWAFHLYNAQNDLGMPLAPTAGKDKRVSYGGAEYGFQVFAGDVLYNQIPKWSEIQSLNALLDGNMPESGLGLELLKASYQATGQELHTDWNSHRFALKNKLGSAMSNAYRITVDGKEYSLQVFALDTLYVEVPNWNDIQRLSDTAEGTVREALMKEAYKVSGAVYNPALQFHKVATENKFGTPLSEVYQVDLAGTTFQLQVYAGGVVYSSGDSPAMTQKDLTMPALPEVEITDAPVVLGEPTDAVSDKRPTFTLLPIAGQPRLSQLYGYTKWAAGNGRQFYNFCQGRHPGIDFAVPVGTPMVSIGHGLVVWAGLNSPFASGPRSIVVRYGGIYAIYGHADSEVVKRGDFVTPGQLVGYSGTLGGPHLHFELRPVPDNAIRNADPMQAPVNPGYTINPIDYFDSENQAYFEKWYHQLGGDSHYCVGSLRNQDRIVFGGPMDTRPCQ